MADHTHIEWTDATWNIVTGCSVVSPGCTNCYAMRLAGTRLQHHPSRAGLTVASKAGPVWNGQVRFNADWLTQPLRWTKPRRIFVAAHGDLFHDGVTDDQLDQIFAVMALCQQHTFQVLTKRPERMRAYIGQMLRGDRSIGNAALDLADNGSERALAAFRDDTVEIEEGGPIPYTPLLNVCLGVSVEDQARADERTPILLDTAAAVRWISAEPLLGPVDLRRWMPAKRKAFRPGGEPFLANHFYMTKCEHCGWTGSSELCGESSNGDDADVICPACNRSIAGDDGGPSLDWAVIGGESGPGARPIHPDWARSLRDQCAAAGVPFLFKQWGSWAPSVFTTDWAEGSGQPFIAWPDGQIAHGRADDHGGKGVMLRNRSKKATGRLLDGALHDGFPEARP